MTATVWAFWRYQAARVEFDDDGIVEHSAFGARRMRWEDIKSVTKDDYVTVVHGAHGKIRFWNTIAFADELRAEVERRCV